MEQTIVLTVITSMGLLSIVRIGGILHAFKTRTLGSVSKRERSRRKRRVESYTPPVEEVKDTGCACCCCMNRASSEGGA